LGRVDIFAVKLWDSAGTLIYSSDSADEIGRSHMDEPEVVATLAGATSAEIVREADDENANQFAAVGPFIEVYAPVTDPTSEQIVGIFEVYQSYAPVLTEMRNTKMIVWAAILAGTSLAYLIQIGMVRAVADKLTDTEAQVGTINERLEHSMQDLEDYSLGTLQALVSAVDAKDSYTASHSLSVTDYAVAIGRRMRLNAAELVDLERASLLHDVGKIGIPESVLLKPARLTSDEFEIVKRHSEAGAQTIESIPFLRSLVPLVRHHHEHWNGTGYPEGLEGEKIPRLARILTVADAFDAMTSDRPYRPGMRLATARQEITRFRGIQFDPQVVDALLESLDAEEIIVALWHHGMRPEGSQSQSA
ncbi:MAG: HD-GYP domain-containing protein, partial [Coriobacteriia bacterium]|nr:HD-GYP domain-containing protein [Coriobacteriia bacterium]